MCRVVSFFFAAAFLSAGWLGSAAEPDDPRAKAELDRLLRQSLVLSSENDSRMRQFKFEYRYLLRESESGALSTQMRLVVDDRGRAAMLMQSPKGVPFLYGSTDSVTTFHQDQPGHLQEFFGMQWQFRLAKTDGIGREWRIANDFKTSVHVDFRELLRSICARKHKMSFDCRRAVLRFERESGACYEFLLNREHVEEAIASAIPKDMPHDNFPIRGMRAVSSLGGTEFVLIPTTDGYLAGPRPSAFQKPDDKSVWHLLDVNDWTHADTTKAMLHSLTDVSTMAHCCDAPESEATGLRLLGCVPFQGAWRSWERDQAEKCLDRLHLGRDDADTAGGWRRETYSDLSKLLWKTILEPIVTMTEPGSKDKNILHATGYERQYAALRLEACAGPKLADRLYTVLLERIVAADAVCEEQLQALDLLGMIGRPPYEGYLESLESSLSETAPDDVRTMLATVKIRVDQPIADADVARLKAALQSEKTPARLRCACLEALLLIDETAGLESVVYETVTKPSLDYWEEPMRCLFAAGRSQEGRRVLLRLAKEQSVPWAAPTAAFLMTTAFWPDGPQWSECLSVAKSLALDEGAPLRPRCAAGVMASLATDDQAFREKFIAAAFRSQKAGLLTVLLMGYLRGNGHLYLDEMEQLLDSDVPELCEMGGQLFQTWSPSTIPPGHEEKVVRVLKTIMTHPQRQVRNSCYHSLLRLDKAGSGIPKRLLPELVQMARNEPDDNQFLQTMILVQSLSHQEWRIELPKNPLNAKGLVLQDQETRRMIQEHRADIQASADAWVKR